jgi:hypothetical protein
VQYVRFVLGQTSSIPKPPYRQHLVEEFFSKAKIPIPVQSLVVDEMVKLKMTDFLKTRSIFSLLQCYLGSLVLDEDMEAMLVKLIQEKAKPIWPIIVGLVIEKSAYINLR